MEARTISINGVIQRNTLLRIPYFQRRYVWGEEDWKRFAIDMESTLDSDRCYFLGAIILKEEPVAMIDRRNGIAKKQLVVDGQQRLTTGEPAAVSGLVVSLQNKFRVVFLIRTPGNNAVPGEYCLSKALCHNLAPLFPLLPAALPYAKNKTR